MNDEGFQSDVVIYRITINAYCKAKKYDDAIERFNEMEAKNIKRTPHIYSTLISGFGAEKRLIEALKFFELSKLGKWFCTYGNKLTYNALMGSYCWSMHMYDAYWIVEEMRKCIMSNESGCKHVVSTYETIVRMFCNEGRMDMALRVWDQMNANGLLLRMHMFLTLINSLCHENKLDDANKYFHEMLGITAATSGDEPLTGYRVTQRRPGDPNKSFDQRWRSPATCVDGRPRENVTLQSRVTALEARLGGGYSSANPSLVLAPLGSSSRFLSSANNIAPEVVPTIVNLPQPGVLPINEDLLGYPCSESLFRLLMSTENTASNILPTTMNLSQHRAFPTYPNMSDYQARLEGFSGGSSQVGSVAEVARSSNPNWIVLGYNSFDYSSSDLSAILNFGTDDRQNF
ncbi:hypothetical protein LguiB_014131 [Lonicera macranthoides]